MLASAAPFLYLAGTQTLVPSDTVLPQLLELICDLYDETRDFLDRTDDAQLWYNRGYADGMVKAMAALGFVGELAGLKASGDPSAAGAESFLPWGKAYRHGMEMGEREAREVLAP